MGHSSNQDAWLPVSQHRLLTTLEGLSYTRPIHLVHVSEYRQAIRRIGLIKVISILETMVFAPKQVGSGRFPADFPF